MERLLAEWRTMPPWLRRTEPWRLQGSSGMVWRLRLRVLMTSSEYIGVAVAFHTAPQPAAVGGQYFF